MLVGQLEIVYNRKFQRMGKGREVGQVSNRVEQNLSDIIFGLLGILVLFQ